MVSRPSAAKFALYLGGALAGAAAVKATYTWLTSSVMRTAEEAEEEQQQGVAQQQAEQLQVMQHEQTEQQSAADVAQQVQMLFDSDMTIIIQDNPEDTSMQEGAERLAANKLQLVSTVGRPNIRTMGQVTWRPMRLTVPTLGPMFTSAPHPFRPAFTSRPLPGFRPTTASGGHLPSFRPRAGVKPFLALPRSPRQSWEDDTVEVQDTFDANPTAYTRLNQDTEDAIEVNCPAYQLEQKVIKMKVDMATVKQQHAMELYLVSSELLAQKQAVLDTCQQQQVLLAQATVDRQNLEFLLSLPQVQQLLAQAQGA